MSLTIETNQHQAPQLLKWLLARRGLALWTSANLSNSGITWTTPARDKNGKPMPKQSWQMNNTPHIIVESSDNVTVFIEKEVKRFRIGIRKSGNGLSMKCTDGATRRIYKELKKAGKNSSYFFDYETQEAVIAKPSNSMTLTEWDKSCLENMKCR